MISSRFRLGFAGLGFAGVVFARFRFTGFRFTRFRFTRFRFAGLGLAGLAFIFTVPSIAIGAKVHVAVATNFAPAARDLGKRFHQHTDHRAVLSAGSTGALYGQVTQGAPYEVFLAADQAHARTAVERGWAIPNTRYTYAVGRLVLYSREMDLSMGPATLQQARGKLAIANPRTAPYGAAAVEVLKALALYKTLAPQLVFGNNVAQSYQFAATGNADFGFVAYSQVVGGEGGGSYWLVPTELHTPIAQDVVLLKRGEGNPAARAFMDFLRTAPAREIVARYGYGR